MSKTTTLQPCEKHCSHATYALMRAREHRASQLMRAALLGLQEPKCCGSYAERERKVVEQS